MNHKHHATRHAPNAGIALVVIAGLFIAFSVIAAVAVERNTTTQLITRRDSANEQLTRISNAIIEYGVFNKLSGKLVYPCPAATNLPISNSSFGASVNTASTQDCNVTNHPGITLLGTDVIQGMVPIQALAQYGLGVNDAFDPWDNRIMYTVNRTQTKGGSSTNTNNPTVSDPITGQTFVAPDFIVMSYGRDGVGATRRESITVAIGCTNGTTKRRYENCDNDTAFVTGPTYTAASAGDTTYFDDSISGYTQAGPAAATGGTPYCWGTGYLGSGGYTSSYWPVAVTLPSGVTSFTSVSAGFSSACGIGNNGLAYCWGQNTYGQLGAGLSTGAVANTPVAVTLPSGVTSFTSIGSHSTSTFCGIGNNGRAYCWGRNNEGQLGNGTSGTDSNVPVAVNLPSGVTSFTSVSGGRSSGCGIGNNGRAYCWGTYGVLIGDGSCTGSTVPVAVALPSGVTSFTSVTLGSTHNCGMGNNGRAYCWGQNAYGLGDGTGNSSCWPQPVTLPSGVTSFTSESAGFYASCGVGNNGRAYCWGYNLNGQLGDGTATNSFMPVLVTLPSGVTSFTSVSKGSNSSSCGIGNNGRAYCWGRNDGGQFGDGTATNSNVPVAVALPTGTTSFVSVSPSDWTGCALAN